jgi:hypothetical protein
MNNRQVKRARRAENCITCRHALLAALPVGWGEMTPRRISGTSLKGG